MPLPTRFCALSLGAAVALLAIAATPSSAQQAAMTFFVTSAGIGNGGNLGGLAGADNHCQTLAQAAGAGTKTWRAYLSTQAADGKTAINARDRIGKGPWQNAKGVVVAKSVEDLHSDSANITKQTALTEKGETVSGRGDAVNVHDILTGSDPQGLFSTAGGDTTCGNWTKSGEGSAIVGHHDRAGLKDTRHMNSWNSSHGSRGCSQDALKSSAASTIACSGFDSRRRIGSDRTGSSAPARFGSKIAARLSRRRLRRGAAAGVVRKKAGSRTRARRDRGRATPSRRRSAPRRGNSARFMDDSPAGDGVRAATPPPASR